MTVSLPIRRLALVVASVAAFSFAFVRVDAQSATAPAPKPITLDDYAKFTRIAGTAISAAAIRIMGTGTAPPDSLIV